MERELLESAGAYTEAFLTEIKDYVASIELMINKDLLDAAEKVARLDLDRVTGVPTTMATSLTEQYRPQLDAQGPPSF